MHTKSPSPWNGLEQASVFIRRLWLVTLGFLKICTRARCGWIFLVPPAPPPGLAIVILPSFIRGTRMQPGSWMGTLDDRVIISRAKSGKVAPYLSYDTGKTAL